MASSQRDCQIAAGARQPGTLWRYGYSTDVLGPTIEIVSGEALHQFEKQHIFDPLGKDSIKYAVMTWTSEREWPNRCQGDMILIDAERERRADPECESGGGGLVSTITDYARLAQTMAGSSRQALPHSASMMQIQNERSRIVRAFKKLVYDASKKND